MHLNCLNTLPQKGHVRVQIILNTGTDYRAAVDEGLGTGTDYSAAIDEGLGTGTDYSKQQIYVLLSVPVPSPPSTAAL